MVGRLYLLSIICGVSSLLSIGCTQPGASDNGPMNNYEGEQIQGGYSGVNSKVDIPKNLDISLDSNNVFIRTPTGNFIDRYRLEVEGDDGSYTEHLFDGGKRFFVDRDLSIGVMYQYRLFSIDERGEKLEQYQASVRVNNYSNKLSDEINII